MATQMAVLGGEEIYDHIDRGAIAAEVLGPHETPFGPSGDVFRTTDGTGVLYLARHGRGMKRPAPSRINDRANIYAVKDLGAACVLSFSSCGAVRHTLSVGDLVLLEDLIDQTTGRPRTFFPDSPLGYLREFPLFCPACRQMIGELLGGDASFHDNVTAAVREGPRMQTPAEIRMIAQLGADVATQSFVPEVFLAKELEMCYVAVGYVRNYAETGSRHAPFRAGRFMDDGAGPDDTGLIPRAVNAMPDLVGRLAERLARTDLTGCPCAASQSANRKRYDLPADWREWF